MRITWPKVEPSAEPIWMIGPSRPTAAPLPMASAEASDFATATTGRITPTLVVDGVHHLRHAVALRLRREIVDDERHADGADHRHQDDPAVPMGAAE